MRPRRLSEIRWYLYRSETKLGMLYDQFVSRRRQLSGNVSLEVPGIKASLGKSIDQPPSDEDRLVRVEKELKRRDLVGTIDDPKEYFG